jgi:hypothetical protein
MTTANVVFSGPADVVKPTVREFIVASGETILPGMLATLNGSGAAIRHNVAGQGGYVFVADLNFIEQKNVTEALTIGGIGQFFYPRVGETYNIVLAASQTIAVGAALTSNGVGAVRSALLTGAEEILFYAEEAITTTGATARIRARVATSGRNALV